MRPDPHACPYSSIWRDEDSALQRPTQQRRAGPHRRLAGRRWLAAFGAAVLLFGACRTADACTPLTAQAEPGAAIEDEIVLHARLVGPDRRPVPNVPAQVLIRAGAGESRREAVVGDVVTDDDGVAVLALPAQELRERLDGAERAAWTIRTVEDLVVDGVRYCAASDTSSIGRNVLDDADEAGPGS